MAETFSLRLGQTEADGWTSIDGVFDATQEGEQRSNRLLDALPVQDFNSNALGVELGQRYESATILADGTVAPVGRDPELHYQPSKVPGGLRRRALAGSGQTTGAHAQDPDQRCDHWTRCGG